MKINLLFCLFFLATIAYAQPPSNSSIDPNALLQQIFNQEGFKDSIVQHLPEGMDSKYLDRILEGNFQDSIAKYMPSKEEIQKIQEEALAKNPPIAPKRDTIRSFVDMLVPGRQKTAVFTGASIYEYAIDQKEITLADAEQSRIASYQKIVESNEQYGSVKFNTFGDPDYDYEQQDTYINLADHEEIREEDKKVVTEIDILRDRVLYTSRREVVAISWQDVQSKLSKKDASIEFIRIEDGAQAELVLVAAVLRPDFNEPKFVVLGQEKEIVSLLNVAKKTNPDTLYKRGGIALGTSIVYGQKLYEMVWSGIDSLLKGVDRVYYAPDGVLHELAFGAIQDDHKKYLSNKYELHLLGTTRTLVDGISDVYPPVDRCWIIAGGLSYHELPTLPSISKSDYCAIVMDETFLIPGYSLPPENTIKELPGTRYEVDVISKLLERKGVNFQKFVGNEVSEEYFARLGKNFPDPGVLHIGTHGYYWPLEEVVPQKQITPVVTNKEARPKYKTMDLKQKRYPEEKSDPNSPFFRSGLYLSGAAYQKYFDESFPSRADAYWTSEGIASQNLTNIDLLVLSACNSGRGDVNLSEGVFGLQRAFKLAGVNKMLVSLWEVSDAGTAIYMENFYTHWLSGMTAYEACQKTQRDMQKHKLYGSPYYWAGFVLLE